MRTFQCGIFERWSSSWECIFHEGAFYKDDWALFCPKSYYSQGEDWCLWARTHATTEQQICWHIWVGPFHSPEVWEFTVNCLPAAKFTDSYYWEAKWSKKGCTNTTNNLLGIWKLLNCGGIARKDTVEWGYVRRNQQGSDGKMIPKKSWSETFFKFWFQIWTKKHFLIPCLRGSIHWLTYTQSRRDENGNQTLTGDTPHSPLYREWESHS